MVRTEGQNIFKFLHALDLKKKNSISKCKLRLLEPLEQPHLKMKNIFELETPNPNNEKYIGKTIGYKLYYVIYGFTTTAIAKLILLANI